MRVGPEDLLQRLKGGLPTAILLFGEEPLLIEESVRSVRQSARDRGFTDRIPLSAETGFDWARLTGSSQTLSLFSEKRLIELRLPTGRPGEPGTRAFADYCETADEDVCLVVISGRLDASSKNAKWVKTLDSNGWMVEHRTLNPGRFQAWFRQRLRDKGLTLERETLDRMCYFLEGNLLAAAQEIDRIALFAEQNGHVDPESVTEGLGDHARFNVYAFTDACLNGDARKAVRILKVLKNEGAEPVLIAWALVKELRALVRIEHGLRNGEQKGRLLKANNIWSTRVSLINAALTRLDARRLERLTSQMARCDRVMKGRERGDVWKELDVTALMMCDVRYAVENTTISHATG